MKPTLLSLKEKLAGMLGFFDKNQRCIYVDYPLHTNVGDLLINTGCEQFFLEHQVNIWRRYNYYDFPKRVPGLHRNDVFLLHGGGNFGDLWFNFQAFRERLLAEYPDNRIIFLPQTVHFSSSEKLAASVERINAHGNYHVFARDFRSLQLLEQGGLRSVSAMPDTAHALAGTFPSANTVASSGMLQLLRQDLEASAIPSDLAGSNGRVVDWDSGTFSRARELTHSGVVNFVKGMGRYGPALDWHGLWYWHRDHLIRDAVDCFSPHEAILTNRLHAMILGLLLGKSVIAFDNNYGKLSAYADSWLNGIEGLTFHSKGKAHAS